MENKFLHKATVIWSNVCRFLLAVVFLFSGFVKANDPLGTVYKVQDYLEAWGLQSLSAGYVPYLAAMPAKDLKQGFFMIYFVFH